jgi:putative hydrolase of the HAD superfamily
MMGQHATAVTAASRYRWLVLPALACFDAGFTLIQPRDSMEERLASVLEAHGHRAEQEDLRRAWEAADAWFWVEYNRPGNAAWTSDEEIEAVWRSYNQLMLEHLGFRDTDHDLLEAILTSQLSSTAWELYEDTLEALELVRAHPSRDGFAPARIAVISDFGSALVDILDTVGLTPYIDVLAISAVEGLAKPDPAFFRLVCERAGIDAADAVMVGDSYRADVLGGRAAGMDAVLLDRNGTASQTDVPVARTLVEAVELAASRPAASSR